MYNMYAKSGCVREARKIFWCKLQDVRAPNRKTIHTITNKLGVWCYRTLEKTYTLSANGGERGDRLEYSS
jgi:hypothetical protein